MEFIGAIIEEREVSLQAIRRRMAHGVIEGPLLPVLNLGDLQPMLAASATERIAGMKGRIVVTNLERSRFAAAVGAPPRRVSVARASEHGSWGR